MKEARARLAAEPGKYVPQIYGEHEAGGTSVLIAVGVALDTMRQMESQMMMRSYEGFLK